MPCNATATPFELERGSASEFLPVTTPPPATVWKPHEEDDAGALRPKRWQRLLSEYRVAEFGCTFVMFLVAKSFTLMAVNDRPIPRIEIRLNSTTTVHARDPTVDERKLHEQVPMWSLIVFGVGIPILTNLLLNFVLPKIRDVRVIPHDVRDFLLSLAQGVTMSTLLTQFTKHVTGRFRPSFYDMCGWDYDAVWDGVTNLCTDAAGEKEGRKSFPSGHASFAWVTMLLLTLYLLGRSRLNCTSRSESAMRGGTKALKLFLCFVPCLAASWVAITRSIDNWHHYSDILAGSIIGAISASFAYSYNYGSIFCWKYAGLPCEAIHEKLKCESMSGDIQEAQEKLMNRNTRVSGTYKYSFAFSREMGDVAGDFRLEADGYQPVCTPALDEKHSSDVATDPADSAEARPSSKKWQKLLRDYRVIEYAFSIHLYIIARRLGKWMKMHKRAFPRIEMRLNSTTSTWGRDPAMTGQTIGASANVRIIAHDFRDFLLSLGQAITLSTFLVNFMKNMSDRFRPCFYAMCGWNYNVVWDGATDLCSDSVSDDEGRKSFPSGNSSFEWSVMGVLTLYLLGRARLTSAEQSNSVLQEGVRTFKLFFCFLPCLGAAWVAIMRSTDNRHHYSDIVAGSVIGAAAACLAYNHNYGSIYSWEVSGLPWETIHERRKCASKL
ncbi:hypothetical protein PC128_g3764 [Phytophthora cactorum]|nr:hypothetical protein PC128_g3764 [Phytophthora cactorum]